jgi:hypothetical protein
MKNNHLTRPGKKPYQSPVLEEYALHLEKPLCTSDKGGTTEQWDEVDLSFIF